MKKFRAASDRFSSADRISDDAETAAMSWSRPSTTDHAARQSHGLDEAPLRWRDAGFCVALNFQGKSFESYSKNKSATPGLPQAQQTAPPRYAVDCSQ
jgi:hypothetical protein